MRAISEDGTFLHAKGNDESLAQSSGCGGVSFDSVFLSIEAASSTKTTLDGTIFPPSNPNAIHYVLP